MQDSRASPGAWGRKLRAEMDWSDDGLRDDGALEDDSWRTEARGGDGEQATVRLVLRMMIDVGLVGFPNAGKSSLLRALTRAAPKVAPYPFTTLAPSLGVLVAGAGAAAAGEPEALRFRDGADPCADDDAARLLRRAAASSGAGADPNPVIGDLPGLIEGAHVGRGLGRIFLKHLRRARVICYVIDVSSAGADGAGGRSPAADFECLFEELRMYNPEYVRRPAVVALNKVDMLPDAAGGPEADDAAADAMRRIAACAREKARTVDGAFGARGGPSLPILTTSALVGTNIDRLSALVAETMREL